MRPIDDRHAPSNAFRARLETTIRDAVRMERRTHVVTSRRVPQMMRHAALLAVGVLLGVGAQAASAQVQEARQRSELEVARELDRRVAVARLQVANDEHSRVRKAFEAGVLSQQSLLTAATDLRAMQLAVARLDLDIAEIRLTSLAPRNELWAPVIGNRDFVKERLRLDAATAQGRLTAVQSVLAEAERGVRAGATLPSAAHAAREEVARAERDSKVHASRLALRDEFLRNRTSPEELMRAAESYEISFDLQFAVHMLELARTRLELSTQNFATGAGVQLDVKRAELEVLERTTEVERLQSQLRKRRE